LADKGYNLARRTVAKYRDILGISAAPLRRIL
jgi:DNA-directed RNA polymerase specialized sigma54-like protein